MEVQLYMKKSAVLVLFLAAFALAACSTGGAAATLPEPLDLTLIATDIAYDVTQVEAMVGQPIRLTLDNQGVLEHDFSIVEIPLSGEVTATEAEGENGGHDMAHVDEEPAVHVAAPAGGSGIVEFTPSAPGEYIFYCTVAGHKEAGMEGILIVRAS